MRPTAMGIYLGRTALWRAHSVVCLWSACFKGISLFQGRERQGQAHSRAASKALEGRSRKQASKHER